MYKNSKLKNNIGILSVTSFSPCGLNLLLVLITWCIWIIYTSSNSWTLIQHYWQVSITMIFGSIIARATSDAQVFSLAIIC
ncbi:MAG: hypothetical protein IBX55_04015 [Methyloprofundus sp.]|nr:hypothetical protein [Methyloprofundus sp.]MBW6453631.1 hypothetical protein [Methyloprofundus sp.]